VFFRSAIVRKVYDEYETSLAEHVHGTQNPSQTNNVGLRGLEVGTIFLRARRVAYRERSLEDKKAADVPLLELVTRFIERSERHRDPHH
jgi:hypothetical protein